MKKRIFTQFLFILVCGFAIGQPTQPGPAIACNSANCTTNANIDVCQVGGTTIVSDFQNASLFFNNGSSGLSAGSIWRFRNIVTVDATTVNCIVTINSIFQATLADVDDDGAVDQANVSIASFFAPQIAPGVSLNATDRRGYVQFTLDFVRNNTGINDNTNADFAVAVPLTSLNFVHYDIDGSSQNADAWFRETGVAHRITPINPLVNGDASTELVGYAYSDGGLDWGGFAGSACERDGVSRCAQVAVAYTYTAPVSSITFRMGYDFNADGNGYSIGNPTRQYGARFGCYDFPTVTQFSLPVKLLSFNGAYRNQATLLNWVTENEVNFASFQVERSSNGTDFDAVGTVAARGSSTSRATYELTDDLSSASGKAFYYRLKMIDRDGSYKYSRVVMILKDSRAINGVTINPNPVLNGVAMVKMTATKKGSIELRIVDQSGKLLIRQKQNVYEGNNSISLGVSQLLPGIYTLQVADGENILTTKLSIVR